MCSAVWNFREDGYELGFNRDEKWTRPLSQPLSLEKQHPMAGACARDAAAGGTWLFTNEFGVTLAVMNAYPGNQIPPPGKVSRGWIPQLASIHSTAEAIEEALEKTHWNNFAPCEILLIDTSGLRHFGWYGEALERLPNPPRTFLTTSSVRTDLAKKARCQRFDELSQFPIFSILNDASTDDPDASIFVTREDAGTVSQTIVTVTQEDISITHQRRAEPSYKIVFPRNK
jgi:uncharacterized protein with NRDE domain